MAKSMNSHNPHLMIKRIATSNKEAAMMIVLQMMRRKKVITSTKISLIMTRMMKRSQMSRVTIRMRMKIAVVMI